MGVRFSGWKNCKRHQRTLTLDGAKYPTEAYVRKAIELTVSRVNSGAAVATAASWRPSQAQHLSAICGQGQISLQ